MAYFYLNPRKFCHYEFLVPLSSYSTFVLLQRSLSFLNIMLSFLTLWPELLDSLQDQKQVLEKSPCSSTAMKFVGGAVECRIVNKNRLMENHVSICCLKGRMLDTSYEQCRGLCDEILWVASYRIFCWISSNKRLMLAYLQIFNVSRFLELKNILYFWSL